MTKSYQKNHAQSNKKKFLVLIYLKKKITIVVSGGVMSGDIYLDYKII